MRHALFSKKVAHQFDLLEFGRAPVVWAWNIRAATYGESVTEEVKLNVNLLGWVNASMFLQYLVLDDLVANATVRLTRGGSKELRSVSRLHQG